jgi:predicted DNA-binding transcriptional regulator AlpA
MIDLRGLEITQAALQFAPAFLRTRDVLRITSLSRATLYRRIAARRFPAPVHLGGRACGWSTSALQDWISDPEGYRAPAAEDSGGIRARGRPLKNSKRSAR